MSGSIEIADSVNHRNLLVAAYLLLAAYFGVQVIQDFESIVATQLAFFDASLLYARVATALIIAAPLSCIILAVLVLKESRWPILVLPAVHVSVFLIPYGLLMTLYTAWWHFTRIRDSAK